MTITKAIIEDSLMTFEACARTRKTRETRKRAVNAHRRLRTLQPGDHLSAQFKDEQTIRVQIQEMLRTEKLLDAEGVQKEIGTCLAPIPSGIHWKATMLIEYSHEHEHEHEHSAVATRALVWRRRPHLLRGRGP